MVIPGNNLGNSQVSVNRTIGPTLVRYLWHVTKCEYVILMMEFMLQIKIHQNVKCDVNVTIKIEKPNLYMLGYMAPT